MILTSGWKAKSFPYFYNTNTWTISQLNGIVLHCILENLGLIQNSIFDFFKEDLAWFIELIVHLIAAPLQIWVAHGKCWNSSTIWSLPAKTQYKIIKEDLTIRKGQLMLAIEMSCSLESSRMESSIIFNKKNTLKNFWKIINILDATKIAETHGLILLTKQWSKLVVLSQLIHSSDIIPNIFSVA